MFSDPGYGLRLHGYIAAKALKPVDLRVAPEPGELTFGIVAMASLGFDDGLCEQSLTTHNAEGLGVPERAKGPGCLTKSFIDFGSFFEQPLGEHGSGPGVDAVVELGARRIQPDLQDAETLEGIASDRPLMRLRSSRQQRNFQAADEFGGIVRVYRSCGLGIEAAHEMVQSGAATAGRKALQTTPEMIIPWRRGSKTVEQSAEIEAGASGNNGESATTADVFEGLAGKPGIVAGVGELVGFEEVETMVRNSRALAAGRLGRADIQAAIDGDRVTGDNFAPKLLGNQQGEGCLATRGGSGYDDEGMRTGV